MIDSILQLFDKIPKVPYFGLAFFWALIIRVILCFFKSFAISCGEADKDKSEDEFKLCDNWRFRESFWRSFSSRTDSLVVCDYWLPFIIGFFDILIYPIFFKLNLLPAIAFWLGYKVLASWNVMRQAYVRFLLGNILAIFFALIMYIEFLKNIK